MRSLACAACVAIFTLLVLASALVKAAADLLDLGRHTGLLQRVGGTYMAMLPCLDTNHSMGGLDCGDSELLHYHLANKTSTDRWSVLARWMLYYKDEDR